MSFLAPAPKTEVQKKPEIQIPGTVQNEPIPYLFGTQDVLGFCIAPDRAANMLYRKKSTATGGKGGFGGGYATGANTYFMNFAIAYCWGPIQQFWQIKIDDNVVFSSSATYPAARLPEGYTTVDVSLSTHRGVVRFYWGTSDQRADAPSLIVNNESHKGYLSWYTKPNTPAYPNLCYAVYQDFEVGTSPTVPKLALRLTRAPVLPPPFPPAGLQGAAAPIGGGLLISGNNAIYPDANPIFVIAEVLTDRRFGAEMPVTLLDTDSWLAAAAQVAREKLGVSGLLDSTTKASELVDTLLKDHCGGGLVRRGGQWAVKLIRREYTTLSDVPLLPGSQISNFEMRPAIAAEKPNQVLVEYRDQRRGFTPQTYPLPHIGHALLTNQVRTEKLEFKYFTNFQTAVGAATAMLPRLVSPPDAIRFNVARTQGVFLEELDLIRPVYPPEGLDGSRIFRLMKLKRPIGGKYLECEAIEEFAYVSPDALDATPPPPAGGSGEPDGGDDTGAGGLAPLFSELPLELPFDLSGGLMQITHLAGRSDVRYTEFELFGGLDVDLLDSLTALGRFVYAGTLAAPYPADTLEVDDSGLLVNPSFTDDFRDFAASASVTRAELYQLKRLMIIGQPDLPDSVEICAFQTIQPEASRYRIKGILRGLFDTRPRPHGQARPDPTLVFVGTAVPFVVDRRPGWANGTTLLLKAVPYNEVDRGDLTKATLYTLTLRERAKRPYPVSTLLANGVGPRHRPTYTAGNSVRLSWIPRTRGAGCGYSNPHGPFDPNIATEGDFVVRIYGEDGATLLRTLSATAADTFTDAYGVTRTFVDYNPALDSNPTRFTVRVNSRVNGWESLATAELVVTQT